jgi:tetratricopeptide (TPR) repeat protein
MACVRLQVCSVSGLSLHEEEGPVSVSVRVELGGESLCTGVSQRRRRRRRRPGDDKAHAANDEANLFTDQVVFRGGNGALFFAVGTRAVDDVVVTVLSDEGKELISGERCCVDVHDPRPQCLQLGSGVEAQLRVTIYSSQNLVSRLILSLWMLGAALAMLIGATVAMLYLSPRNGQVMFGDYVGQGPSVEYIQVPIEVEVIKEIEVPVEVRVEVPVEVVTQVEVERVVEKIVEVEVEVVKAGGTFVDLSSIMALGDALLERRPLEAALAYQVAISSHPDNNAAAFLGLGRAHLNVGATRQALEAADNALEASSETQVTMDALLLKGQILSTAGLPEDALLVFEEASARWPDNVSIMSQLGAAYLAVGRPEEAIAPLEKVLSSPLRHKDAGYAAFNIGVAFELTGQVNQSKRALQLAVELGPPLPAVHVNLGVHCLRQGRMEEAREEFDLAIQISADALALDPTASKEASGAAHLNLAAMEERKGALQSAVRHYNAAAASGMAPKAFLPLSRLYHSLGQPEAALDVVERALAMGDRVDRAPLLVEQGIALKTMGLPHEAAAAFRAALDIHDDYKTLVYLGDCQKEMGAIHDAIHSYSSAIQLAGDPDPEMYSLLQAVLAEATGEAHDPVAPMLGKHRRVFPAAYAPPGKAHGDHHSVPAEPLSAVGWQDAMDRAAYDDVDPTMVEMDAEHIVPKGGIARDVPTLQEKDSLDRSEQERMLPHSRTSTHSVAQEERQDTPEYEVEEPTAGDESEEAEVEVENPIEFPVLDVEDHVDQTLAEEDSIVELPIGIPYIHSEDYGNENAGEEWPLDSTSTSQEVQSEEYTRGEEGASGAADAADYSNPEHRDSAEDVQDQGGASNEEVFEAPMPPPDESDIRAAESFIRMGQAYASQEKGALAIKQYEKAARRCPLCWNFSSEYEGAKSLLDSILVFARTLEGLGMDEESRAIMSGIGVGGTSSPPEEEPPTPEPLPEKYSSEERMDSNFHAEIGPLATPEHSYEEKIERSEDISEGGPFTISSNYGRADTAQETEYPLPSGRSAVNENADNRPLPYQRVGDSHFRRRFLSDVPDPSETSSSRENSRGEAWPDTAKGGADMLDLNAFLRESKGAEREGGVGKWLGGMAKQVLYTLLDVFNRLVVLRSSVTNLCPTLGVQQGYKKISITLDLIIIIALDFLCSLTARGFYHHQASLHISA